MTFLCAYWLILAIICVNHASVVKRQTQSHTPFRQRMTLEELLEPSEIRMLNPNSVGGQVSNPLFNILQNLDPTLLTNLDLSLVERTIANMLRTGRLGPRHGFGLEDPMEPAELGDGGMLILPVDSRSGTQGPGSLINILRILRRQQSPRSSANQQTSAPGSGSEQSASGQEGIRDFRTRPRGATNSQNGATNSRIILPRLQELLNRLSPDLKQLSPERQTLQGGSRPGSKSQQTYGPNQQRSSASQYNPQYVPENQQSTDPFSRQSSQQAGPMNLDDLSRLSQSGRSDRQRWSKSSNKLSTNTRRSDTRDEARPSNFQMESSYSDGRANYPQGGSNSPWPGSISRQWEPNYSQGLLNNPVGNQVHDSGAQGNNGNSQARSPANAPIATTNPVTFVDNRPDFNLKVGMSIGNQQEVTPDQQAGATNSQIGPVDSKPGMANVPSNPTDSLLGSPTAQTEGVNQQSRQSNTQTSLNNLQAAFGEARTVVDNPPPAPSNTVIVTDPFVNPTVPEAVINPSDPSAPGAPVNAPLDTFPEWTTPGLITPEPGKSSLLVIPGPLLGKKVYTNS